MSRRDEPTEYDYELVEAKLNWQGEPVESKNGKSRLVIFKQHNNVELWVPKKVSKFKLKDNGEVVAMIESWWCRKQEELS